MEQDIRPEEYEIYRELIIDHYKHPRHKTELPKANGKHTEYNPLCGDVITFFLKIENGKIEDASFLGSGCAISQASASLLTDELIGKPVSFIEELSREDIVRLLSISISPTRTKCAVLSMVAAKEAVKALKAPGK